MGRRIIADVSPIETRVALLEEDQLVDVHVEVPGNERLVGNIYKGRAADILPGMQAAFIDIGLDKNAFLYAGDAAPEMNAEGSEPPKIEKVLSPGEQLLVQVVKQPGGTKGARVTAHITLPDRLTVLMPTTEHIGISRRITDEAVRGRLYEAARRCCPEGMGLILRTAAAAADEKELAAEIALNVRLWEKIRRHAGMVSAPRLIHAEENLLYRTVRDAFTADVDELVINDAKAYEEIRSIVKDLTPQMLGRIRYYGEAMPIFDVYGLEERIERLLQRRVWLKNGAYLVIDETEALTVIDVNSGKYTGKSDLQSTILHVNLEAADEIARQMRLRDLGGIIIVDFIDMQTEENKQQVLDRLQKAVSRDRTGTHVLGMTRLGLVEMTRKRSHRRFSTLTQTVCPCCGGTGTVPNIDSLTRRVRIAVMRHMENARPDSYIVEVPRAVCSHILVLNAQGTAVLPEYPRSRFYIRAVPGTLNHLQIRTADGDLTGAEVFH